MPIMPPTIIAYIIIGWVFSIESTIEGYSQLTQKTAYFKGDLSNVTRFAYNNVKKQNHCRAAKKSSYIIKNIEANRPLLSCSQVSSFKRRVNKTNEEFLIN